MRHSTYIARRAAAVYGALSNEKQVAGAQLSFWISAALLILAAVVAAIGVKNSPNSPEARSEQPIAKERLHDRAEPHSAICYLLSAIR